MSDIKLRPFQAVNKAQIRKGFETNRAVLYQAGTGSGKTVVATDILKGVRDKGEFAWFIAHRRELINQTYRTLWDMKVNAGIIMAGHKLNPHLQIQVASIGTLNERYIKNDSLVIHQKPKIIVIDEAHRSLSKSYLELMKKFPDAYILGLTATPIRSDGKGLGHVYGSMVQAPDIGELIEMGYLVQPRYFTGATASMEGVKTHNHDYASAEREARMNNADLRGDVVEQWLRHGERRKTFVFASGVKHSMALRNDFLEAGVRAAHIDGQTPDWERDEIMHDFRNSDKYEVLTNCMVFVEGTDVPEVGCVSLACPSKIISKYIQMGGRCLRPHEPTNKKDCIILDHSGLIARHGFLESPVPWTLDTEGKMSDVIHEARDKEVKEFVCTACGCTFSGQVRCPECNTKIEINPQHELISTTEELIEVTRGAMGAKAKGKQAIYTDDQKRHFHAQLKGYAGGLNPKKKAMSRGWIGHTFRAKFGHWPDGYDGWPAEQPQEIVKAFIRAKNANFHIRRKYNENRT
jgi:DNA repair protein RadD